MRSSSARMAARSLAAATALILLGACASAPGVGGLVASASPGESASTPPARHTPAPRSTRAREGPSPSAAARPGPAILPDPARTPGATNPSVTPATLDRTICLTGYTSAIRPPESYTYDLKVSQLDSGYAYRGDTATGDYEEDHLIPLELGGSPTSQANLWPEPYDGPGGAHVKDLVENQLHDLVCSGRLPLALAQQAIATNWWNAYQRYGGETWPHVYLGRYS